MSTQQPSARVAVCQVVYSGSRGAGVPQFQVNRGFRDVLSFDIPPGPGPTGCVQLLFDSISQINPEETIVHVSVESDLFALEQREPAWQYYFDATLGEYTLLVIPATCTGSTTARFTVEVTRIN